MRESRVFAPKNDEAKRKVVGSYLLRDRLGMPTPFPNYRMGK